MKINLLIASLLLLFSCQKKQEDNHSVNVASFTYLPFRAMSVVADDVDFGMGAGGVSIGFELKPGSYYVYWSDAGTGANYKSKNQIVIPQNITARTAVLHVYDDQFVELEFTNESPKETERGLKYKKEHHLKLN